MNGQAERPEAGQEPAAQDSQEAAQDSPEVTPESASDISEDRVASELEALQVKADENWDKYLRALAELDNVRKRATRDVEKAHKFALEPFARELLNVRDSLEMGLSAAAEASEAEAVLAGFEATLKQLVAMMERFGISELDPEGEPFDPQEHEAMTMQPATGVEPGTVLTVFQKGYALNGRLLRPARVVVAQAPADTATAEQ